MNRKRTYSVLVAEDEPLIRRHIVRKLVESCPGFEVVAEAADGKEALESIAELYPDVLVTDIRMPVMDGFALIREASYGYPDQGCFSRVFKQPVGVGPQDYRVRGGAAAGGR